MVVSGLRGTKRGSASEVPGPDERQGYGASYHPELPKPEGGGRSEACLDPGTHAWSRTHYRGRGCHIRRGCKRDRSARTAEQEGEPALRPLRSEVSFGARVSTDRSQSRHSTVPPGRLVPSAQGDSTAAQDHQHYRSEPGV